MKRCNLCLLACLFSMQVALGSGRPNILWITIEDTSPQFIGAYGNEQVHTPNIDRLIAEGVRFDRAFATSPVCSPTRFTIITGVNTQLTGTGNHRSSYPIPDFIKGFPAYLRQAGYYTSNNSKTDYNTADHLRIMAEAWDDSSGEAGWWDHKEGQPFFSIFNYETPHQSRTMTNSYRWYVENILDKLPMDKRTSEEAIEVPHFYKDTPELRKQLVRVHNSINLTDIEIGKLLQRLENEGLMDETIIFFYSDHGEGIPRGKCAPLALGYQAAFAVWAPEKYRSMLPWEPGTVTNELISFEDLAPTLLSLADQPAKDYMTGRSFMGNLAERPPRYIYTSRDRIDETIALSRTVIGEDYFYTRIFMPQYPLVQYQKYAEVSDITTLIRQQYQDGMLDSLQRSIFERQPVEYLFDLKKDTWQIHNLAGDPAYASVLNSMRDSLYAHIQEVQDIHFLPEYSISRLSEKTTPYSYRKNPAEYPLRKILQVASLPDSIPVPQLLSFLQDANPAVRYWAAVRLGNIKENLKPHSQDLLVALRDDSPEVQIALAGVVFQQLGLPEAREILTRYALDDHPVLALQALHVIQYLNSRTDFMTVLRQVIKRKEIDQYEWLDVKSSAETTLHCSQGRPLSYD